MDAPTKTRRVAAHRQYRTVANRSGARVLVPALVLVLASPSCDPLTAGLAGLGATSAADKLVDGLKQAIERMDQAIHDHRGALKADVLEVVANTREQVERLLQDTHAVASALEETVAADLAGDLSTVLRGAEQLTRDIEAAANDSIRFTAEQLRSTIARLQNGPMREAKATARILLAKGERTAEGIVISVVGGATVLIIRIGAGLLLLVAAIGLIVAAVKKSGSGVVVTTVLALGSLGALVFAPYLAKMSAEKRTVQDPEASCEIALRQGVVLDQALVGVVKTRANQIGMKAVPEPASPAALRVLRGANELRLLERSKPQASPTPNPILVRPKPLLTLPTVAPGARAETRPRLWFGSEAAATKTTVASTRGKTASTGNDAVFQAAMDVREHGPVCVAYSMSPQKADACERYINQALAYLGVAVVCTSSAQCPEGQWCDEHTAACMELGVYCQRPDHCKAGTECDTSLSRCVSQSTFACSPSAQCRPGQLCSNGRCSDDSQVVGQPCTDLGKQGPCMQGILQRDGHGGVVCRSNVAATAEVCDGIDNNCNGTIDEGIVATSCTAVALGRCAQGRQSCRGGRMTCEPGPSSPEKCNGVDDNCNGRIDDDPSCEPKEMTGGSIKCGFAAAANTTIGDRCPGYVRESCYPVSGPQNGSVGHAEFVDWETNDPGDCRCKVHCGTTWRTTGEKWNFKITARKRDY